MRAATAYGPLRRAVRRLAPALLLALLGACASDDPFAPAPFEQPETALDYEVVLEGAPSEEIADLLEASLAIYRQQDRGAQSLAFLRRRAQGDVETAQTILRSRGYYQAEIATEVVPPPEGTAPASPGADGETPPIEDDADAEAPPPEPVATLRFLIEPGPQLTLAAHRLSLVETGAEAPAPLDAAALGSPVGGPAEAAAIVGAEQAAVAKLHREGRPYAEFRDRDALADLEAGTLEVDSTIAAGRAYSVGEIRLAGAPNVDEAYLLSYLPFAEGDVYSTADLKEFQGELFETGLFAGVSVRPPEEPPEGAALPVLVELEEAPARTVSAGIRFSTDEIVELRAGYEHRNLFGAGERLGLSTEVSLDEQVATATFLKPQFLRPAQDLTSAFEVRRVDDDRFEEIGATLTLGLERRLGPRWTVGVGGLLEAAVIDEGMGDETSLLAGLPFFAAYDSTDNELDATRGQRLRLAATPFLGVFADDPAYFLRLQARGSAYQDLLGDKRLVLAERARIGTIVTDALGDVPANRRFYSGGGGSVRGYAEDLIGPLDLQNDPTGGLSVLEAGIELRARVWGDIGVAVFSEAGVVSQNTLPDLSAGVQVGAGAGLRYYSPVGPIRLDIAVPVNGRDVDDSFQAYLSIGQSF